MTLSIHDKIKAILTDKRLAGKNYPLEEMLENEYGADNIEEAIYELRHTYGVQTLYKVLTSYLQKERFKNEWDIYQVVLWYIVMDLNADQVEAFFDADFLVALLYFRWPNENEGDRIWSIYCELKKVPPWIYDDPLEDKGIQNALIALKRTYLHNETKKK